MSNVPANNRNRDREQFYGHAILWMMDNAQNIAKRSRDNLEAAMLPGIPADDRKDWERRARLDQAAAAREYAAVRAALPFVGAA